MKRAIVMAGAAALLASGAAAAQETAPAPAQEPPKCAIRVNDVDLTTWREVRADGFTFCVPPEWNPRGRTRDGVDPREWRGPSGSIEWGKGRPRPVMGSSIVTVPRGERPPPPPPPQR
ncbi:MAG TPA: hypothetical protein VFQ39_19315, partial [Longimicrobium sp.]|nr:hypothetical protein [Longimicrobium sp.]